MIAIIVILTIVRIMTIIDNRYTSSKEQVPRKNIQVWYSRTQVLRILNPEAQTMALYQLDFRALACLGFRDCGFRVKGVWVEG